MNIGILLFDRVTQLDATGPYECFARMPGANTLCVGETLDPVVTEHGLRLLPDVDLDQCPPLDLLCIPGGYGVNELMVNQRVLAFVRQQAEQVQWLTSVCTGSLVLGAAGLLRGKRATSHWLSVAHLTAFGAIAESERMVRDGNIITAGGITAGIDFALWVIGQWLGEDQAKQIQLMMQYDPQPPFTSGTPGQAGDKITSEVTRARQAGVDARAQLIAEIVAGWASE